MAATPNIRGRNTDIPGSSSAAFPSAPRNVPQVGKFTDPPRTGQIRDLGGRFAGGMSFAWNNLPAVVGLAQRLQHDMYDKRDTALERIRQDMVDWAKDNAPWQDRSGDARAELHSPAITTSPNGDKAVILAHGVAYGIYIETFDGGSIGIIAKAINEFASRLPSYMSGAS